ncbi:pupal cuticle protein 20-like [Leptidea sinapis]|uniref:pupal cuticle protein 20-like n=1 Tax=Leptidea sinapis TaxID=189913 RepID=UPI002132805C|nr:pupal cuticle protein 20-like [Leptidea sinapis]
MYRLLVCVGLVSQALISAAHPGVAATPAAGVIPAVPALASPLNPALPLPTALNPALNPALAGYNGYRSPYYNAGAAVPILSYSNERGVDGSYSYSFATGDGKQAQESGFQKDVYIDNTGSPQGTQVVEGSYAYVSPEGTPIQVSYVADENGFRPSGVHIPADGKGVLPAALPAGVLNRNPYNGFINPYNPLNNRNPYNYNQYNPLNNRNPYNYNQYNPHRPYGPAFNPATPYNLYGAGKKVL